MRKQEFVELVRAKNLTEALSHASTYLAPAAKAAVQAAQENASGTAETSPPDLRSAKEDCMLQLQKVMSMLAFPDPAHCGVPDVEALFSHAAWEELAQQFCQEAHLSLGLFRRPLLEIAVSLGQAALKTPSCKHGGMANRRITADGSLILPNDPRQSGCPLCDTAYFDIDGTAMCRRSTTRLLCPITRDVMNDHNPPLALPNGHVYASKTLDFLSSEDRSKVLCPHTGEVFSRDEIRRVYVI